MSIEATMRRAYAERGICVFWPEQFESNDTELVEVLSAFKSLAEQGRIRLVATAYCEAGHAAWSGPPEKIGDVILECHQCNPSLGVEMDFQVRAELSPELLEQLEDDKLHGSVKKKASGWGR